MNTTHAECHIVDPLNSATDHELHACLASRLAYHLVDLAVKMLTSVGACHHAIKPIYSVACSVHTSATKFYYPINQCIF